VYLAIPPNSMKLAAPAATPELIWPPARAASGGGCPLLSR
jgi:hypothetical protein